MLYVNPVLDYDYKLWCCNHIWLNKQPLFLWQMALSMKVFGINEFGLRFPSALLGAIQVLLVYRIGSIALSRRVGYIAAFLFALNHFNLELTSGSFGRDHNDLVFAFLYHGKFLGIRGILAVREIDLRFPVWLAFRLCRANQMAGWAGCLCRLGPEYYWEKGRSIQFEKISGYRTRFSSVAPDVLALAALYLQKVST